MLKPLLALPALLLFAQAPQQPTAPAPAAAPIPAEAKALTNPVTPNPASQAHAKKVFGYDCAVCHGATGNGKGDLAADMKVPLKDYTDPASLQNLTDGELFYILKNGQGQMPGDGGRSKPEDLWNMVLYVRSLSKK
jgi:mono/diheme cytochrome c family protein